MICTVTVVPGGAQPHTAALSGARWNTALSPMTSGTDSWPPLDAPPSLARASVVCA